MAESQGIIKKVMSLFSFDQEGEEMEDLGPAARTPDRGEQVSDKVVSLKRPRHAEISIFSPQNFDDARMLADNLKAGKAVIINLGRVDVSLATRIVDFVSGIIYALEGASKKVGDNIFVFTPAGISITADEELLSGLGGDHGIFFTER